MSRDQSLPWSSAHTGAGTAQGHWPLAHLGTPGSCPATADQHCQLLSHWALPSLELCRGLVWPRAGFGTSLLTPMHFALTHRALATAWAWTETLHRVPTVSVPHAGVAELLLLTFFNEVYCLRCIIFKGMSPTWRWPSDLQLGEGEGPLKPQSLIQELVSAVKSTRV